nr:MAG TPA: hypothetical protein [Caudoviricetes sp.]
MQILFNYYYYTICFYIKLRHLYDIFTTFYKFSIFSVAFSIIL